MIARTIVTIFVLCTTCIAPSLALAQSTGGQTTASPGNSSSTSSSTNQQNTGGQTTSSSGQTNTTATNQTLQYYNPNIQIGTGAGTGGNGFQGMNFSGVGGALVSCLNIGQSIMGGINGVFNSTLGSLGSKEVPTKDSTSQKELKKQTNTENCLNGIAYAVAKNMLQQLSNKTLNWINTGFNGNPFYVRDIDSYLKSIKDQKLQNFLGTVPINDPIFGNAIRSEITRQITGKSDGLLTTVMNTPQAKAYNDFQNDFTKGGWNAFLNMNNNAVGAFFNAVDTVDRSINTAQQNVKDELTQGQGFLSMKKCAEYSTDTSGNNTQCIDQANSEKASNIANCANNQSCITRAEQLYQQKIASCQQVQQGQPQCVRYENVTPGSVIAQQAAYITNSPVRQLEKADKINEVLGSFFDQLLNRLFNQGLGGASGSRGMFGNSGTGIGNNVVIGSNGQALSSVSSGQDTLGYDPVNGGFNGDFDISRPQQLRAIIKTQKDYLNRATDSQIVLNRIVPRIGALDYCLPGPNPSWALGVQDNFATFVSYLQQTGGLFNPAVVARNPALYDKTTDGSRQLKTWSFTGNLGNINVDLVNEWLKASFNSLANKYTTLYSQTALSTAFQSVATSPADQIYARGFIKDALRETGNIASYNQNVAQYNAQYAQTLDDTDLAIQELESIQTEVQQIVSTAKARYIAAQATAGTPVTTSCIDQAYQIDTTPIVGVSRIESDMPDPFAQQSAAASAYFYSNL